MRAYNVSRNIGKKEWQDLRESLRSGATSYRVAVAVYGYELTEAAIGHTKNMKDLMCEMPMAWKMKAHRFNKMCSATR